MPRRGEHFEKIKKEDGSIVAKCLMCWEKSKDTVVTRKITDSSTKGLINHIQSYHKKYVKKWEEQKDANDQLRASYNPIRKKNKKTDDGTKQQTLIGGNQGILQVEARHDAGAQKRFDEAPSNVLCNDNDSFQCTETRPFVCQSSVSQISRQNPDQDTQNNLQSHEEEGC